MNKEQESDSPVRGRVPSSRQVSPERLSIEREIHNKMRRQGELRRIGFFVFTVVMAGLLVGGYFLINRGSQRENFFDRSESVQVARNDSIDELLKTDDVNAMMRHSIEGTRVDASTPLPQLLEKLEERLQIANRMSDLKLDEKQTDFVLESRIETLGMLCVINTEHDLDNQRWPELLDKYSKLGLDHPKSDISRKAYGTQFVLASQALAKTENPDLPLDSEPVKQVEAVLRQIVEKFDGDIQIAKDVDQTMRLMRRKGFSNHADAMEKIAVTAFLKSKNEDIVELGQKFISRDLLEGIDTRMLCLGVAEGKQEAIDRTRELVVQLVKKKHAGPDSYYVTLSILEAFLAKPNQVDYVRKASAWIREALKEANPRTRTDVGVSLSQLEKRINLLGTKVELSGELAGGEKLDSNQLAGQPVAIIFVPSADRVREISLENFRYYEEFHKRGMRFLVVPGGPIPEAKLKAIQKRYSYTSVLKYDPEGLQRKFNITFLPYLSVVGKDGAVIRMNVHPDNLRSTLNNVLNGNSD